MLSNATSATWINQHQRKGRQAHCRRRGWRFEGEPAPPDHVLLQLDNFVATPHSSSSTEEALERMILVAEDVIAVVDGQEPRWAANSLGRVRTAQLPRRKSV